MDLETINKLYLELSQIVALQADNRKLRYLLARQHESATHRIYGDDGELQCGACWIDFRLDTVADIERKLYEAGMRELQRLTAVGEWPPALPQRAHPLPEGPGFDGLG